MFVFFFFFQAEDGIRDVVVTGVQTCALPISSTKGAYPLSPSLRGRTVGILGLGRIGKAIAARVTAFGLSVVYYGRNAQADVPYRYYSSLVDMANAVDVLIVVAPGGPGTRHIINAEVLEALGPDGVLINVARGSLVEEKALIEALRK